jgi:alkylhydroperoxidase family enzyme
LLRKNGFSIEQLRTITTDYRNAGLEPAEVAMMEYAQKVALRAYEVTAEDVTRLRAHGFTDSEILDIALAAAARCFFSKLLDAVGAEPDEAYAELAEALADVLPAGRPFGSATGNP